MDQIVVVERLENALHRAICSSCHGARAFVWAHWSIDHWYSCRVGASRWQSTRLTRSRRARARPLSARPFHPNSGGAPDSAATAQSHFCHTPSGAGLALRRKEAVDLVARSAVSASRKHQLVIGGSSTAQDQRWNGP